MTTLPQTTHPRLPRPRALAAPTGNGALSAGPAAAATAGMTPADVWRVIRANLILIIASLVIALVVGFVANWLLAKYAPKYTATGYVQVQQPTVYNPVTQRSEPLGSAFDTLIVEQRTQSSLLRSDSLFSNVLGNPNSPIRTNTEWFKQFITYDESGNARADVRAAKQELEKAFSATPIPDSKLIAVSMTYAIPKDCKTIVDEIVGRHLEDQRKLASDRQLDRLNQLMQLRQRMNQTIIRKRQEMNEKGAKLQIDGMNPASNRLSGLEVELAKLIEQQLRLQELAGAAQSRFEQVEGQLSQGIDPPAIEEMVNRDPQVQQMKMQFSQIEIQLRSQISSVGPQSKVVQNLQFQRDETQRELDRVIAAVRTQARLQYREMVAVDAQSMRQQFESFGKQVENVKAQLGELAVVMSDYRGLEEELRAHEESYKQVTDQIDAIQSMNQQPAAVLWAMQPVTPDIPSFPKLPVTLALAGFLGLALSLGVAFLREMLDTTVRSPRDIAKVGPMNVLGMIPHEVDDPQSGTAPLPLVIFQAPTSIMAEQYRQVRTRLQHTASLDTTRSILVTSPSPGDGKTVIACNLAAGLALNGRRILLVDANFRRPELHKVFGVDNSSGLSTALGSLENFESTVQSTQVPNLDVLPTGPKPQNPTELLESQLLTDLIERALEEYDHVVFDSGPMLVVSETVALAPRVDGVITVVRAATNSRGLLQRLRDGLKQLKAEHLGVILNAVRSQAGGYYNRNIKTYYEYQNGHSS